MSRQSAVCDDATLDMWECLVTEWFAGIMRISIFIISSRSRAGYLMRLGG